jgi:predicted enzyme related to lactoylglutathione lyase
MELVGRHRMIVFDCGDPEGLAGFWSALTGAEINAHEDGWWSLRAPATGGLRIGFQRVPEPKTVKNRVHVDLDVDSLDAATTRAEELGARRVGDVVPEGEGERFQVLLDPESNEFCLLEGYR